MAEDLELAPEGQVEFGTLIDEDGEGFIAMRFNAHGIDRPVVLTWRFDHFTSLGDQMQSIATELINGGWPPKTSPFTRRGPR